MATDDGAAAEPGSAEALNDGAAAEPGSAAPHDVERWPLWKAWLYALCSANPRSNREIVALAAPDEADVVLDVGCGPGAAVRRAAARGADATGIDPSAAMVALARRRSRQVPGARFAVGDAANLPLMNDTASLAWAIATYHHWPDRRAGLAEIHRVLRPGGRLLIAEHRLRRSGGHGLSDDDAERTVALLRAVGFRDAAVQRRRLRIMTMLIVDGIAT